VRYKISSRDLCVKMTEKSTSMSSLLDALPVPPERKHGSTRREIIVRGQSYVSRLPKYWPPPLTARRVFGAGGGHQWWANLDQASKDLDKTIFRDLSPTPIPWVREKFTIFWRLDQMSGLWSMFWFKSFRKFFGIFRNFDHWSEILSLSADRPFFWWI
jgi:hypothetical protein